MLVLIYIYILKLATFELREIMENTYCYCPNVLICLYSLSFNDVSYYGGAFIIIIPKLSPHISIVISIAKYYYYFFFLYRKNKLLLLLLLFVVYIYCYFEISGICNFLFLFRFTVALMFYAVSYSSIYLGGDIYLSFFLTNVILLPAVLITILGEKM